MSDFDATRDFFPQAELVVTKFEPKFGPWLPVVHLPLAAVVASIALGRAA